VVVGVEDDDQDEGRIGHLRGLYCPIEGQLGLNDARLSVEVASDPMVLRIGTERLGEHNPMVTTVGRIYSRKTQVGDIKHNQLIRKCVIE
jgi:hypothetical protein